MDNDQFPSDWGPIYQETTIGRIFVEPWNSLSSLFIVLAAILVLLIIRNEFRKHTFLTWIFVPLLFLGGMGSTIFHGFRSTPFFLFMDFVPISLLSVMLALFFWYRVYSKLYFVIIIGILVFAARAVPALFFDGANGINISYFLSGVLIIIPLIVTAIKQSKKNNLIMFYSFLAFVFGLLFRYTDPIKIDFLPMGTHFLWHLFTGIGAYLLGNYIYQINRAGM